MQVPFFYFDSGGLQFTIWEGTRTLAYPIFVPSAMLSLKPL